ncbi:hypothetical protein MPNT_140005 [Candidatus Methylacidithermus pantelleriae]|uniref:Uncharacterized protein n=1 Tax=Candidatus Methylacidithermus pantelleriae TaxID=2744239 RepID=A0A8J2FS35_9BACT|nr:hypothetical protein MPNT_140005 [Candidatus Methylacidithermus pantelleriae]
MPRTGRRTADPGTAFHRSRICVRWSIPTLSTLLDGGLDDGPIGFAVMCQTRPHLSAGKLPELGSRAPDAVGGKTTTQGKEAVALVAQLLRR